MSGVRFGTDGVRGLAGEWPITPEVAAAVGSAAVRLGGRPGARVAMVRDTRPSGAELARAVRGGVIAAGGTLVDGGVLPTSAAAHAVHIGLAESAVAITASHNPAADNGFKVFGPGGHKLADAASARFESWIEDALGTPSAPVAGAPALTLRAAWGNAVDECLGDLSALEGRHIAIDLANGAATAVQGWLEAVLPCQLTLVGAGEGAINDRVGSTHPQALANAVRGAGCDAGIAVDGDADRCVLVDGAGQVVAGDALTYLLARGLGVIGLAATVMSNAALEPSLPGVRVVRTPVGDRHLAVAMREHGLQLGAEESGHVLFSDGLVAGDGLLTGLRALSLAWKQGESLASALAGFEPFPRWLGKIRVASRPPLGSIDALQLAITAAEAKLGAGGRVFLRYSGTEPVLRILIEGRLAGVVEEVSADITEAARRALT